jgi:hypothetical protein
VGAKSAGEIQRFPFSWSQRYDVVISYVGYAEAWDPLDVRGSVAARNCMVAFRFAGKIAAVATIQCDRESLQAETLLEPADQGWPGSPARRHRAVMLVQTMDPREI